MFKNQCFKDINKSMTEVNWIDDFKSDLAQPDSRISAYFCNFLVSVINGVNPDIFIYDFSKFMKKIHFLSSDQHNRIMPLCLNYIKHVDIASSTKSPSHMINIINPFEVMPVKDSKGHLDVLESFNACLDRIGLVMKYINPSLTDYDLHCLSNILSKFYIERGMWSFNPLNHISQIHLLGLPHNQYPTFSEFQMFLECTIYTSHHNNVYTAQALSKLSNTVRTIIVDYSRMLDSHTNSYLYPCYNHTMLAIHNILYTDYISVVSQHISLALRHSFIIFMLKHKAYKWLGTDPYDFVKFSIRNIIFNRE